VLAAADGLKAGAEVRTADGRTTAVGALEQTGGADD
jgi:hypothetical protein